MILLALGACSATTTGPTVAPAVASFGPGGHGATLTGSGSTFDGPFFDTAFTKFHQQHPAASISYAAVGSSAGIAAFSIGYLEDSYTRGLTLPVAAIRNQAGHYVTPSAASITAAAAQKPHITAANFAIVNQPGANSYPITGYSWALVYTHQPSQATGRALVSMLDWLTHTGQAYAATTGYVPLPPQVQQLARTTLQQITGPDGTHLLS